jgi:hypothetical protein
VLFDIIIPPAPLEPRGATIIPKAGENKALVKGMADVDEAVVPVLILDKSLILLPPTLTDKTPLVVFEPIVYASVINENDIKYGSSSKIALQSILYV